MKTTTIFRISLCLTLLALLAQAVPAARAQAGEGDTVTLAALGEKELLLAGPIDSTSIDFILPAHWSIQTGAVAHLNLRAFIGTDNAEATADSTVGFIDVYLNDTWLNTIALDRSGQYSVDVAIPDSAWVRTTANAPQSLRLYMHDALRCGMIWSSALSGNWRGINVAVYTSSYLYLPHQLVPVPTDLRALPYPLYQNSFMPEQALLIVPATPNDAELQAALTVSAALGRMTVGDLKTSFITIDKVTAAMLAGAHAIFIGNPANFPLLAQAELPAPVSGNGFANPAINADDGVLQMVASPANPALVWVVVSGHSNAGIIKAAQAFGSGQVRPFGPDNLAIITEVTPQPDAAVNTDFTLGDLGYNEQTYSGYGITYFAYWIDIPSTHQVTDGAYFEMSYNNSALLNFDESGVSVLLNDQFVGGVRLNDRTTSVSSMKFNIPAYMFRAGRNLLLLEVNLTGMSPCIPVDEVWFSIKPLSLMHIPFMPVPDVAVTDYSLTSYPAYLFPTFENSAFVLQRDNPGSWEIAANIAYNMGITSGGTVINPVMAYADALPEEWKQTHSFLLIGRPSQMPIIGDLAPVMPGPFDPGKDIANETTREFKFNVPENVPVGYLQVFPSPWNNRRVILAINANSDEGLVAASRSLLDSALRSQMAGNLAAIYNNQVLVTSVEIGSAQAAAVPAVTLLGTPMAGGTATTAPFQIDLVTIGLIVLAVMIILGIAIWGMGQRKKKA